MVIVSGSIAINFVSDVELFSPDGNCRQSLAQLPLAIIDPFVGVLARKIIACFGQIQSGGNNKASSNSVFRNLYFITLPRVPRGLALFSPEHQRELRMETLHPPFPIYR